MIIGNVNSYLKTQSVNNSNYKHLQKVLNTNNKINTIKKKDATENPEELLKKKIRTMKAQLKDTKNAEEELKNGISILQAKNKGLDNINDIENQLKELSTQYNKYDLSENDKSEIEKRQGNY